MHRMSSRLLLLALLAFEASVGAQQTESPAVPEAATLPLTLVDAESTGEIALSAPTTDCRQLTAKFRITVDYAESGAAPPLEQFVIWYPGVRQVFSGVVCVPTREARLFNVENQGSFKVPAGSTVRVRGPTGRNPMRLAAEAGKLDLVGTLRMTVQEQAQVFRVDSDASTPLSLVLAADGYRYVSGRGSVTSPSGRVYRFP